MMLLAFILSCVIAGSLACSEDHCKDPVLANELLAIKFMPNKEELGTLCPKVLTFLECEKDFYECPGPTLEELAISPDKAESKKGQAMLIGMSLVRELCDGNSSLHEEYLASIDCFRSYIEPASRKCREDVTKPIESFFDALYPTEEELGEEAYAEIRCLSDALEMACFIDNLGDSCGSDAKKTAMTVLERIKSLLKAGSCSHVENAADLKSKFLDFLELDDDEKSKVYGIFDFYKRRR